MASPVLAPHAGSAGLTRPATLVWLVVLCLAVGGVGGWVTSDAVREWYPTLAKPAWTPPNWLFGPVWTALYLCIGVAGWRVSAVAARSGVRAAWRTWWVQLGLNAAWSPLFFGAHRVGAAALVIVALWIAIATFIVQAWRGARPAAWLFVPYLAWVSYASALNLAIWQLNR
ncbi:MAG: TspO/MBR family protein [Vicinamibacterales bacterium]